MGGDHFFTNTSVWWRLSSTFLPTITGVNSPALWVNKKLIMIITTLVREREREREEGGERESKSSK